MSPISREARVDGMSLRIWLGDATTWTGYVGQLPLSGSIADNISFQREP
jgi:hypothetical protein